MAKTIGHRLFRLGRIPLGWRERLEREGIRILDEGIRYRITYRSYRAPGRYYAWRRSMGSGAVVLTHRRLLLFYYRWPVLDVELAEPRLTRIGASSPAPDVLVLTFEASDFDPRRRGRVTVRLRTAETLELLTILGGQHSPSATPPPA